LSRRRIAHDACRLLRRTPLKDLDQLTHLTGQRHAEVLGVMELVPVPFIGEGADPLLKVLEGHAEHWTRMHWHTATHVCATSARTDAMASTAPDATPAPGTRERAPGDTVDREGRTQRTELSPSRAPRRSGTRSPAFRRSS